MIRGLYSAATALDVAQQNHEVIAHNLAHANVPGYRRRGVAFETFDQSLGRASSTQASSDIIGSRVSSVYHGFEAGPIHLTGNPLNVALEGDGFFVLQGRNGPLYTRNGSFKLGANGELQSSDGLPVRGTGGPIRVPPNTAEIAIAADGTVSADNTAVGQLQVARFPDARELVRVGTTLFEAPAGVQPQAGTGQVRQGYLEGANVQVVNEMVAMIASSRRFESAQRALRALSQALQLSTRPQ
jgi:flagellar basal-body rod protein FlgF